MTGGNQQALVLRYTPVTTLTSIYFDTGGYFGKAPGAFPVGSLLTEGTDYVMQYDDDDMISASGIVLRLSGAPYSTSFHAVGDWPTSRGRGTLAARALPAWPRVPGSLKLTYTAGFVSLPGDLVTATMMLAQIIRLMAPRGGYQLSSESLGQYSYSILSGKPELGSARQLLSAYRVPKAI